MKNSALEMMLFPSTAMVLVVVEGLLIKVVVCNQEVYVGEVDCEQMQSLKCLDCISVVLIIALEKNWELIKRLIM